jgi:hypothetical protein
MKPKLPQKNLKIAKVMGGRQAFSLLAAIEEQAKKKKLEKRTICRVCQKDLKTRKEYLLHLPSHYRVHFVKPNPKKIKKVAEVDLTVDDGDIDEQQPSTSRAYLENVKTE